MKNFSLTDVYYKLRPDSVTGSNSSKSFELLRMPQAKSGNPNGSGSGHTSGDDMVSKQKSFSLVAHIFLSQKQVKQT